MDLTDLRSDVRTQEEAWSSDIYTFKVVAWTRISEPGVNVAYGEFSFCFCFFY